MEVTFVIDESHRLNSSIRSTAAIPSLGSIVTLEKLANICNLDISYEHGTLVPDTEILLYSIANTIKGRTYYCYTAPFPTNYC